MISKYIFKSINTNKEKKSFIKLQIKVSDLCPTANTTQEQKK